VQQFVPPLPDRTIFAQRLRRVTEDYLYRVRLIALEQARAEARHATQPAATRAPDREAA
jgi:hypothetical protein